MKKSLFSKLIKTYVWVILLSILIIGVLFSVFFVQYFFSVKEHQLLFQGKAMNIVLGPYFKSGDMDQVGEVVHHFNRVNIPHMWVLDREGQIISGTDGLHNADDLCPESDKIERALQGKVVTGKEFIKYFNEPVLSVALPITVESKVVGAIFVCNPLSDILHSIIQTLKIILFASIMAILITLAISYFISKSIVKPIEEMTHISQEMSRGNFSHRATVTSDDEIGKLAETFNDMIAKLEQSLHDLENEKNKMAQMELLQREFVANTSHELRTPLTTLRGYLEAMLDGVVQGEEQERKYLRTILKETIRLHRLVNSLLDLSQIESGQMKANSKQIHLAEIIERTVSKLEPLAENKELQLKMELPTSVPPVLGDEDLIEQVLINYITNAIQYTSAGGSITVHMESNDSEVMIHVTDTGIGIPETELSQVWKRFYKINDTRPLSREGAGLGLALVKEIIELLGGRTWATSTPNVGSTFSFSLLRV